MTFRMIYDSEKWIDQTTIAKCSTKFSFSGHSATIIDVNRKTYIWHWTSIFVAFRCLATTFFFLSKSTQQKQNIITTDALIVYGDH